MHSSTTAQRLALITLEQSRLGSIEIPLKHSGLAAAVGRTIYVNMPNEFIANKIYRVTNRRFRLDGGVTVVAVEDSPLLWADGLVPGEQDLTPNSDYPTGAPAPVTDVTIQIDGDGNAVIAWNHPTPLAVEDYDVEIIQNSVVTHKAAVTFTSFDIPGLQIGSYTATVRARNIFGLKSDLVTTQVALSAPNNPTVYAESDFNQITLHAEMATAGLGTTFEWMFLGPVSAPITDDAVVSPTYTRIGLNQQTAYKVKCRAINKVGKSGWVTITVTTTIAAITGFVTDELYASEKAALQAQIDGAITTWFYDGAPTLTNAPANSWVTTSDKNTHLGDLYYDNLTGYAYRFMINLTVYQWNRVSDSDVTKALADAATAQDTADSKRRVFVSQPIAPYDIGDLWDTGGAIKRCQTAKGTGGSYAAGDWLLVSDTTDYGDNRISNTVAEQAAQAKADLAETTAKAYADDIVTAEEARAIADAQDKADAAEVAGRDAAIASVGGINLTKKATFHSDLSRGSWSSGTVVAESGLPGATHVLQLTTRDSYEYGSLIPVVAGEVIHVSAWVNTVGTTNRVNVGFRQGNETGHLNAWPLAASLNAGIGWTRIEGTYTVPAGVTYLIPFLQISATSNYGTPKVTNITYSRFAPKASRYERITDSTEGRFRYKLDGLDIYEDVFSAGERTKMDRLRLGQHPASAALYLEDTAASQSRANTAETNAKNASTPRESFSFSFHYKSVVILLIPYANGSAGWGESEVFGLLTFRRGGTGSSNRTERIDISAKTAYNATSVTMSKSGVSWNWKPCTVIYGGKKWLALRSGGNVQDARWELWGRRTFNGASPVGTYDYNHQLSCIAYYQNGGGFTGALNTEINNSITDITVGEVANADNVRLLGVTSQQYMPNVAAAGAGSAINTNPITAIDNGSTAKINIAAHTRQYGFGTLALNAGSVSGLSFSTKYYVYYDDPDYLGGTRTYYASTNISNVASNNGRVFIGLITTPSNGGGTVEPPEYWCVGVDMWLTAELSANDATVGDDVDIWLGGHSWQSGAIERAVRDECQVCVEITTESGAIVECSISTPIELIDGRCVLASDAIVGTMVATLRDNKIRWEPVTNLRHIGEKPVMKISVGNSSYAAGRDPKNRIITHNAQVKP